MFAVHVHFSCLGNMPMAMACPHALVVTHCLLWAWHVWLLVITVWFLTFVFFFSLENENPAAGTMVHPRIGHVTLKLNNLLVFNWIEMIFYSKHHAAEGWDLEFGSNTTEKFQNSLKKIENSQGAAKCVLKFFSEVWNFSSLFESRNPNPTSPQRDVCC